MKACVERRLGSIELLLALAAGWSLITAGCGGGASKDEATGATSGSGASGAGNRAGQGGGIAAGSAGTSTAGSTSSGAGGNPAGAGGATTAGGAGTNAGTLGTGGANAGGAAGTGSGGGGGASTAGAGGGTAGSAPLGALTVSNLAIEKNSKMSLGCYVRWTTSEPADSEVQFGIDGYQLRIVDDAPVTEHELYVVGMHAETAYRIKAVSTSQTATGSAEGDFTTGTLPEGLPDKGTLVATAQDKMQPGWTLTNFHVGGSSNFSTSPAIIVIVDEEAIPVWYFVHGDGPDQFGMTSTVWLPNGNVLIGNASAEPAREVDLEGNVVWEGPTGGDPPASHHTSKLATGNYLIVRESNASARVEELNPVNQVVWTWDLYDHLQPKTTSADWCHLNSASMDETKGILYFNCRFQGLFAANRTNGALLWQLGAAIDDSNAGDVKYLPDNSARFNDSHNPEVHADGTILFYDNDGWANHTGGEGNGTFHSRVVEYQFDDAKKEATLAWEFPGSFSGVNAWYKEDWSTPIWGDANRLENGNVLVTAGIRGAGTHTRIFEVTRAGEVVWGFEWPENNGSYRANRISPAPAVPYDQTLAIDLAGRDGSR